MNAVRKFVSMQSTWVLIITRSETRHSEFDVGPGGFVLLLWVESSWIAELTIVVLSVEGGLSILADLDEVGDELSIGHVLVKVVLEMLNEVHVLLNKVVSSNSWEGESGVIELPGVDEKFWVLSEFLELAVDFHGVIIVLSVEFSGEIVQLDVELALRDLETFVTTVLIKVDDVTVWIKPELGLLLLNLNSTGGSAQSSNCDKGEFHLYFIKIKIMLRNKFFDLHVYFLLL
jgi:hypothetical protein